MRNERAMVRAIVSMRSGLRRGLPFEKSELAAIDVPTLMVYGTCDPVGSTEIWRQTIGLLPRGELRATLIAPAICPGSTTPAGSRDT